MVEALYLALFGLELLFEQGLIGVVVVAQAGELLVFAGDLAAAFVQEQFELLEAVPVLRDLLLVAAALLGFLYAESRQLVLFLLHYFKQLVVLS